MKKKRKNTHVQYFVGCLMIVMVSLLVGGLFYKAKLASEFTKPIKQTLISSRRQNGEMMMNQENTTFSEVFTSQVPNVKRIVLHAKAKKIAKNSEVSILLSDADSGAVLAKKQGPVASLLSKSEKKIKLKIKKADRIKQNRTFQLTVTLFNPQDTTIIFVSNSKEGMVTSVNGNEADKTNIVYALRYDSKAALKRMYVVICGLLLVFLLAGYTLVVYLKKEVTLWYPVIALLLGFAVNFIVVAHGVPDEPAHIDTAYFYSNKIMRVAMPDNPATIYKRTCDVRTMNMLKNGVESNSYYLLSYETFHMVNQKEAALMETSYVNAGGIVPAIVYIPAALGMSIGRALHFSYIEMILFARLINLMVFICLMWMALKIVPFGKHLFAMIGLLPITIQEAVSLSYDAVINGILFLFVALCLYFAEGYKIKVFHVIGLLVCGGMLIVTKGGVFVPLGLLLYLWLRNQSKIKLKKRTIAIGSGVLVLIAAAFIVKFLPTIQVILNGASVDGKTIALASVIKHPDKLIYLFWNTLFDVGDNNLRGMLGGLLSWVDIRIPWFLVGILGVNVVLISHVQGDSRQITKQEKRTFALVSVLVIGMICFAMLFAFTLKGANHIEGLQGRYYLSVLPLLVWMLHTSMIHVKKEQADKLWMSSFATIALIFVQFTVLAIGK